MSTVMLLLAHPRATSYCHAIAERIGESLLNLGHEVRSHDLYAELFDPVLTAEESHTSGGAIESVLARENDPLVALHREELRVADGLVTVHPNWWGMPPAIRPVISPGRLVRKTCRWARSCATSATWVKATARNTAVARFHHEEPIRKNAVHPPMSIRETTVSRTA